MERGAAHIGRDARLHDRRCGAARILKQALEPLRIDPLGDAGAYVEYSAALDLEVNAALQGIAAALRASAPAWVRDVVPALAGIALQFDPGHAELPADPLEGVAALLAACTRAAVQSGAPQREVLMPVCYDPSVALDIVEVAERTGIALADIPGRHSGTEHRVLMMGFAPGQPYIGGLDGGLALPRRATPRTKVPAGSVAIANDQTAVYPFEISGGWNVIGRTPLVVFDAKRDPPSLFAPGDRVRFAPITLAEYERLR